MHKTLIVLSCVACHVPPKAPPEPAANDVEAESCRSHDECASGVCDHFKADNGTCAPVTCAAGERTDNNHFYCGKAASWQPSKKHGETCSESYECFEPTCFMDPMCETRPKEVASCDAGTCRLTVLEDACSREGNKRVLHPDEYVQRDDGGCMESLAQRVLQTVCVPCGNGKCDADESVCNCPEDCSE